MEESENEIHKRTEMMRMYQGCKQALKVIGDINMNTIAAPVPPPVKDEWMPTTNHAAVPPR